jgi:hypothetical protein
LDNTESRRDATSEDLGSSSEELLQSVQATLNESGGVEELLNQCETLTAYKGNNYHPLLWQFYKSHRSVFFRLIQALEFESTTTDQRLINALNFLRENEGKRGEWLTGELDLSFASKEWQKLVIVKQGEATKVVRRHFEVCLFSSLAFELKSGDIYVKGSGDYADWRQQLLSWKACQEILPNFCANLDLPTEANQLADCLQNSLRETAEKVDLNYPNNGQVIINEQGEPTLKKVLARPISPTLKNLEAIIAERMPSHHLIAEVLNRLTKLNIREYSNSIYPEFNLKKLVCQTNARNFFRFHETQKTSKFIESFPSNKTRHF